MKSLRTVFVTLAIAGFHQWKDAPDEVAFLRNMHRHLFHIKVQVEVTHNNRDVEFFLLKQELREIIQKLPDYNGLGYLIGSCEMLAEQIASQLPRYKVVSVEVNEDQENGAILYF